MNTVNNIISIDVECAPYNIYITARDNHGMRIGELRATIYKNYSYLWCMYVKEEHRRKGYGSIILQCMLSVLLHKNITDIRLGVVYSNLDNVFDFYINNNFVFSDELTEEYLIFVYKNKEK